MAVKVWGSSLNTLGRRGEGRGGGGGVGERPSFENNYSSSEMVESIFKLSSNILWKLGSLLPSDRKDTQNAGWIDVCV